MQYLQTNLSIYLANDICCLSVEHLCIGCLYSLHNFKFIKKFEFNCLSGIFTRLNFVEAFTSISDNTHIPKKGLYHGTLQKFSTLHRVILWHCSRGRTQLFNCNLVKFRKVAFGRKFPLFVLRLIIIYWITRQVSMVLFMQTPVKRENGAWKYRRLEKRYLRPVQPRARRWGACSRK